MNNVRPTTDPEASAALRDAIDETARQASDLRSYSRSYAPRYARPVTPASKGIFHALRDLARELGYETRLEDLGPSKAGSSQGWPAFQITLDDQQSPPEAISTYCHEISHILLGHVTRTEAETRRRLYQMLSRPATGDPREEVACELAAAAVIRMLGIGDGRQEAVLIRQHMRGRPVPQDVRDAALLAARVLWTAVGERRPAYAYAA